ncbi:MAG: CPBP family intramembrane glutamic endopeptidase [Planctomycetota bacterium]
MRDRRAVLVFLLITFALTFGIEGVMLARGFSLAHFPPLFAQLVILSVMWVPGASAVLVRKIVLRESLRAPAARLHVGVLRPYLIVMLVMPAMFAVVYGITVLLGLGKLDLSLATFLAQMQSATGKPISNAPPAGLVIAAIAIASITIAPFLNGLFAFGEEYGWRGFLLPELLPLGRVRAHLIGGVIWGLWHAPLVLMGFNYPGHPWAGIAWMCALTTLLGIFESEWTLRHRSTILASFIHGSFNAQAYGVWRLIVADVDPLLGGLGGCVGLAAAMVLAAWALARRAPLAVVMAPRG